MAAKLQADLTPPTYETNKPGVPEDAGFGFRKGVKTRSEGSHCMLTDGSAESGLKSVDISGSPR